MTTPKPAEGAKPIAREPTAAMFIAGTKALAEADGSFVRHVWRAMWDAAPSPEGVGLKRLPPEMEQILSDHRSELYEGSAVGQEGPSEPEGGG